MNTKMGTVEKGPRLKKFERLADRIERRILDGALAAGDRVPSVRETSHRENLSINTVLKAYELLERKGLLATKPQSGFYVLGRPEERSLRPSEGTSFPVDVKIPDLLGLLIDASKDKSPYQFGAAYLAPDLYPSDDINRLTRRILREFPRTASTYELSPGMFEYRRRISKLLSDVDARVPPEEILATNGGAEAISLALRAVCKPGDTVVTESPLFFGTLQAMEGLGLRVLEISSHPATGIDLDELRVALKKHRVAAAVLMPNFSNPLGSAMDDDSKREVVRLMVHHGVPVIEDDIYAELPFRGERPKPLRSFDDSGLVITCSSFSKTVSPGLRIGWIAPGRFHKEVRRLQLSTTMASGTLSQKVMAHYAGSKTYAANLRELRLLCSINVHRTAQEVLEHFPEGTRVSLPRGGFLLWVELPRKIDSVELYRRAIARKISFSPGILFSATSRYRNFLRLNCGNVWSPRIEEGLRILGSLAKKS